MGRKKKRKDGGLSPPDECNTQVEGAGNRVDIPEVKLVVGGGNDLASNPTTHSELADIPGDATVISVRESEKDSNHRRYLIGRQRITNKTHKRRQSRKSRWEGMESEDDDLVVTNRDTVETTRGRMSRKDLFCLSKSKESLNDKSNESKENLEDSFDSEVKAEQPVSGPDRRSTTRQSVARESKTRLRQRDQSPFRMTSRCPLPPCCVDQSGKIIPPNAEDKTVQQKCKKSRRRRRKMVCCGKKSKKNQGSETDSTDDDCPQLIPLYRKTISPVDKALENTMCSAKENKTDPWKAFPTPDKHCLRRTEDSTLGVESDQNDIFQKDLPINAVNQYSEEANPKVVVAEIGHTGQEYDVIPQPNCSESAVVLFTRTNENNPTSELAKPECHIVKYQDVNAENISASQLGDVIPAQGSDIDNLQSQSSAVVLARAGNSISVSEENPINVQKEKPNDVFGDIYPENLSVLGEADIKDHAGKERSLAELDNSLSEGAEIKTMLNTSETTTEVIQTTFIIQEPKLDNGQIKQQDNPIDSNQGDYMEEARPFSVAAQHACQETNDSRIQPPGFDTAAVSNMCDTDIFSESEHNNLHDKSDLGKIRTEETGDVLKGCVAAVSSRRKSSKDSTHRRRLLGRRIMTRKTPKRSRLRKLRKQATKLPKRIMSNAFKLSKNLKDINNVSMEKVHAGSLEVDIKIDKRAINCPDYKNNRTDITVPVTKAQRRRRDKILFGRTNKCPALFGQYGKKKRSREGIKSRKVYQEKAKPTDSKRNIHIVCCGRKSDLNRGSDRDSLNDDYPPELIPIPRESSTELVTRPDNTTWNFDEERDISNKGLRNKPFLPITKNTILEFELNSIKTTHDVEPDIEVYEMTNGANARNLSAVGAAKARSKTEPNVSDGTQLGPRFNNTQMAVVQLTETDKSYETVSYLCETIRTNGSDDNYPQHSSELSVDRYDLSTKTNQLNEENPIITDKPADTKGNNCTKELNQADILGETDKQSSLSECDVLLVSQERQKANAILNNSGTENVTQGSVLEKGEIVHNEDKQINMDQGACPEELNPFSIKSQPDNGETCDTAHIQCGNEITFIPPGCDTEKVLHRSDTATVSHGFETDISVDSEAIKNLHDNSDRSKQNANGIEKIIANVETKPESEFSNTCFTVPIADSRRESNEGLKIDERASPSPIRKFNTKPDIDISVANNIKGDTSGQCIQEELIPQNISSLQNEKRKRNLVIRWKRFQPKRYLEQRPKKPKAVRKARAVCNLDTSLKKATGRVLTEPELKASTEEKDNPSNKTEDNSTGVLNLLPGETVVQDGAAQHPLSRVESTQDNAINPIAQIVGKYPVIQNIDLLHNEKRDRKLLVKWKKFRSKRFLQGKPKRRMNNSACGEEIKELSTNNDDHTAMKSVTTASVLYGNNLDVKQKMKKKWLSRANGMKGTRPCPVHGKNTDEKEEKEVKQCFSSQKATKSKRIFGIRSWKLGSKLTKFRKMDTLASIESEKFTDDTKTVLTSRQDPHTADHFNSPAMEDNSSKVISEGSHITVRQRRWWKFGKHKKNPDMVEKDETSVRPTGECDGKNAEDLPKKKKSILKKLKNSLKSLRNSNRQTCPDSKSSDDGDHMTDKRQTLPSKSDCTISGEQDITNTYTGQKKPNMNEMERAHLDRATETEINGRNKLRSAITKLRRWMKIANAD